MNINPNFNKVSFKGTFVMDNKDVTKTVQIINDFNNLSEDNDIPITFFEDKDKIFFVTGDSINKYTDVSKMVKVAKDQMKLLLCEDKFDPTPVEENKDPLKPLSNFFKDFPLMYYQICQNKFEESLDDYRKNVLTNIKNSSINKIKFYSSDNVIKALKENKFDLAKGEIKK